MIPCPACGEPLAPADARCPACKGPRVLARTEGDTRPACAFHADRVASAACARCGGFGCAVCLAEGGDGSLLCPGCRRAARAERLAWDGPAPRLQAFTRSVGMLLFRPEEALSSADAEGGLLRSMLFAFLASLPLQLGQVAALLLFVRFLDDSGPLDAGTLAVLVAMLVILLSVLVAGWLFALPALDWLVLRAMRSKPRSYRSHVRASALSLAPLAAGAIPLLGLFVAPLWSLGLKARAYRTFDRTTWAEAAVAAVSGLVLLLAPAIALGFDLWFVSLF